MLKNGDSKSCLTAPKENNNVYAIYYILKDIGKKIRIKRFEMGLTQEDLEAKSGVSKDTIKRYEGGKIDGVRIDNLLLISRALNVSIHELIPFENDYQE